MTRATNPENGSVFYTYDGAHHVLSKTDAIGQQTQYSTMLTVGSPPSIATRW